MSLIITPEDPEFYDILHSAPPPGWRQSVDSSFGGAFGVRENSLLLQPLSPTELDDYLYGGEYDELEWLDGCDTVC